MHVIARYEIKEKNDSRIYLITWFFYEEMDAEYEKICYVTVGGAIWHVIQFLYFFSRI